tara:strand:- start:22927 stop:23382 length:456 start_codon:yes stop_codon:yes gene_type:complete
MIIDELNTFCWQTSLNTGAAGSYLLGDVIDMQNLRDIGQNATPLYLVIRVTTAATSGGSATGNFSLCSDAQAAIAVDGSQTTHVSSGAIAVASLVAGYEILEIAIPLEGRAYERYVGIVQTTAVAAFTAGKISAFLTPTLDAYKSYPNAVV